MVASRAICRLLSLPLENAMTHCIEWLRHLIPVAPGRMRRLLRTLLGTLSGVLALHIGAAEAGSPLLVDYSDLVAENAPMVVSIMVHQNPTAESTNLNSETEQGSGFIFDGANGYILTNAHVIENQRDVTVTMTNRQKYPATVVGYDSRSDLAVLQIHTSDLEQVRVGNSDTARIGEPVVAIGAPFGFELTVTAGILSARNRTLEGLLVPFLQVDAAVNPGNSGGPLFNRNGEVIGVNSRIFTTTGGFTGLAFAIPSNLAMPIAHELIAHGKVEHAQIGLRIQDLTPELARAFGAPADSGALVVGIDVDGPAQGSGLQVGDIITQADSRALAESVALPRYIDPLPAGQKVHLTVWRAGVRLAIEVRLGSTGEQGPGALLRASLTALQGKRAAPYLQGLTVRALGPEERIDTGVEGGLIVTAVQAGSPAQRAGLKVDDILLRDHVQLLTSVKALREAWTGTERDAPVLVKRAGDCFYVLVTLRSGGLEN